MSEVEDLGWAGELEVGYKIDWRGWRMEVAGVMVLRLGRVQPTAEIRRSLQT